MLYVGGQGGVFRSFDGGQNWTLFPDGTVNADGTPNTTSLLNSPLGNGGGLPNAQVTDLDLSLGNVDPTTGRPDVSTGPNVLLASTFGRGQFTVRLAPIVFPNTPTNSAILHLSTTAAAAAGDQRHGVHQHRRRDQLDDPGHRGALRAVGLRQHGPRRPLRREQLHPGARSTPCWPAPTPASSPGSRSSPAPTPPTPRATSPSRSRPATSRRSTRPTPTPTRPTAPSGSSCRPSTARARRGTSPPLGQLLFNQFGETGAAELADPTSYSFILDTTPPVSPSTPVLQAASDSGLSQSDDVTNVTANLKFNVALSAGEPATTRVYLVRDSDANIVDSPVRHRRAGHHHPDRPRPGQRRRPHLLRLRGRPGRQQGAVLRQAQGHRRHHAAGAAQPAGPRPQPPGRRQRLGDRRRQHHQRQAALPDRDRRGRRPGPDRRLRRQRPRPRAAHPGRPQRRPQRPLQHRPGHPAAGRHLHPAGPRGGRRRQLLAALLAADRDHPQPHAQHAHAGAGRGRRLGGRRRQHHQASPSPAWSGPPRRAWPSSWCSTRAPSTTPTATWSPPAARSPRPTRRASRSSSRPTARTRSSSPSPWPTAPTSSTRSSRTWRATSPPAPR